MIISGLKYTSNFFVTIINDDILTMLANALNLHSMDVSVRKAFLGLIWLGSMVAHSQNFTPANFTSSTSFWEEYYTFETDQLPETFDLDLTGPQSQALARILAVARTEAVSADASSKSFLKNNIHLALYLSGFNPVARGAYDRKGLWMLTYADARRYGLRINQHTDDRMDIMKNTRAAAQYFKDLKKRFGKEAELRFVCGPAGFARLSQPLRDSISQQLQGLEKVVKNFDVATVSVTAKPTWDTQTFSSLVYIDQVVEASGITHDQFAKRNPTLISNSIPAGMAVQLPEKLEEKSIVRAARQREKEHAEAFKIKLAKIRRDAPSSKTHRAITYRVKSGDVLGRIAMKYGVSVSKIKKWNKLRSDRINIGQKLVVYYPKNKKLPKKKVTTVSKPVEKPEVKLTAKEKGLFTIYEVQAGDTLWAISRKFEGVKPEHIMQWNDIGEKIKIGQKLKIKNLQ